MQLNPIWLLIASLLFALVPIVIGVCTCYLKVSIVLGLLKNALGTQNTPGSLVVMALSISITFYIMGPIVQTISDNVISSGINAKQISKKDLAEIPGLFHPLKEFLVAHTGEPEMELFKQLRPKEEEECSYSTLIPAFMISELKDAFRMGFVVLLPFLVIDLVVANVLAGLGMYMMSPTVIALPIKLLLFVASDAWMLLMQSLILSYRV